MKEGKMSPTEIKAPPLDSWTYLSLFKVQYLSRPEDNTVARVLRNGRQQVPIEIAIEGRNAQGEVVEIPKTDLDSIEFIIYETQAPLPSNYHIATLKNPRFDYYPENTMLIDDAFNNNENPDTATPTLTKNRDINPQAQLIMRWLTTDSYDTAHIGAKITYPDSTPIHTCSADVPPGGASMGGGFNSSLRIYPQQIPTSLHASDIQVLRKDETGNKHFDVDIYELCYTDDRVRIIDAICYTPIHAGGWFFSDYAGDRINNYHYVTHYNLSNIHHDHCNLPNTFIDCQVNTQLKSHGKLSLVRIKEKDAGVIHDITPVGKVGLIDTFGNESIIYLHAYNNGNMIMLADK